MQGALPIKSLVRLSILISLVISSITFLFLLINMSPAKAAGILVMDLLLFSISGSASIYLLVYSRQKFPGQLQKAKTLHYTATYLVSMVIFVGVWSLCAALSLTPPLDSAVLFLCFMSSIVINTLNLVVQHYVLLVNAKAKADLELAHLKTAHAKAENLLLKQQVHPHFLFNSLNTIKSLYRRDAKTGEAYLVHLANFLRASISNHSSGISTLSAEIALLKDYVEMQKVRFGSAFNCMISIDEEAAARYLLPSFSLQPLVENAIKHNELTEEKPLVVFVQQQGDLVTVTNPIQRKALRESSTGSGLANLADRYRLWTGDDIYIEENKESFTVSIKLLGHEHRDHRR